MARSGVTSPAAISPTDEILVNELLALAAPMLRAPPLPRAAPRRADELYGGSQPFFPKTPAGVVSRAARSPKGLLKALLSPRIIEKTRIQAASAPMCS